LKPVTLKDLAQKAGVSPSTVSKALLDKEDIGEYTKQQIRALAAHYNYTPNSIARSLRTRTTMVLGVIIPDNTNPYFAQLIKGIEDTARRMHYSVIVLNTDEKNEAERACVKALLNLMVAGILAVPINAANYEKIPIPLIFLSRKPGRLDLSRSSYVVNDDFKGAFLAAEHLIKRGYRQLFYVNGPKTVALAVQRMEGFEAAILDAGLKFDPQRILFGHLTTKDGYRSLSKLLKLAVPDQPIGILCFSDHVAIGLLAAVRDARLRIPEQIGIVGYDDIEILQFLDTPLTTIRQARYAMGVKGVDLLLGLIEDNNRGEQVEIGHYQVIMEPELIVRSS
jgi:LacI family transcriptional regulator